MNKLKAALASLLKSLGVQNALHARAVRKMKARHVGQKHAEIQAEAAEETADKLRVLSHESLTYGPKENQARGARLRRKAERKDKKAGKLKLKAAREETRAIFWKGRVRVLAKRIEGIETDVAKVREEIAALVPTVHLDQQKVTGGSFRERWVVHNLTEVECCSNGRRRNAYSQSGSPDIWHPYGPGPAPGRRDDCSSDTTASALSTGADDPNGLDFSGEGFTGTLAGAHGRWKEVTLDHMIHAGQGYIVYGSGSGHHVERYCPSPTDNMRTVGHGSPPVDFGTVHLFGSGEVERYFIYVETT